MENDHENLRSFIREARRTYDFSNEPVELNKCYKRAISNISFPAIHHGKQGQEIPEETFAAYQRLVKTPKEHRELSWKAFDPVSSSLQSRNPEAVLCSNCKSYVTTKVVKTRGVTSWLLCLILCVFCFPFCIYPLVCDVCLDTLHVCPSCEAELASIPII